MEESSKRGIIFKVYLMTGVSLREWGWGGEGVVKGGVGGWIEGAFSYFVPFRLRGGGGGGRVILIEKLKPCNLGLSRYLLPSILGF